MTKYVVDTNVPIVANGYPDPNDIRVPSSHCRKAAVKFLMKVLESGLVLLDTDGLIQEEYRRYLNPEGQPGVGDRFYQEILNSHPQKVQRVDLTTDENGQYSDLPREIADSNFDQSDRKFAAIGFKENAQIVNATDSDWLNDIALFNQYGLKIFFLCTCNEDNWYE